jgi:glycerate 2-kinase
MREHAITIFQSAVQAVQPQYLLPRHMKFAGDVLQLGDGQFPLARVKNIYLIGAGKAAAAMAREAELILGEKISEGLIVTKYDHGLPLQFVRCLEAGHPLPDEAGMKAGEEIAAILKKAGADDIVIALISGGASALMVDCPPGASLFEVQQLFAALLACGATIGEMNTVRKHLSPGIKGGQLVRSAFPATLVSFILSDVPGDQLDTIASGPTVPDTSTFKDAWFVLEKYNLVNALPGSLKDWLTEGVYGVIPDTPKPGDKIFENSHTFLIGANHIALQAAEAKAKQLGYATSIISETLTGEARLKAVELVQFVSAYNGPKPACLLLGGETTVTIKGNGTGGRNQEFVLAALIAMKKNNGLENKFPVILSAGTDGTDGPTPVAGAAIDYSTLKSVAEKKLSPEKYLQENDSYNFFQEAGGLIITGPTQTNVMDVVVVLMH